MGYANLHTTPFFWLLLVAFVVALAARRVHISYPLALVIAGLAIGLPRLMPRVHLEPRILFTVLLPPLLFEAAINLPVAALRRDWKPIALFVLIGTVASTLVVGWLMGWVLQASFAIALVFGALISATDPISVVAVFRRLGVDRRLRVLLEAESLFNDSIAVILFTVSLALAAGGHESVGGAVVDFFRLGVGGAAVGIVIGAVATRVHFGLDDHLVEITLTTIVAYGSYLAAETIGLSGVMAVITAGLVVGSYAMRTAMTPTTRLAVAAFWEYAAFVVNSLVFLLIGIEVAYVHWLHQVGLAAAAIAAVLIGRSTVYLLAGAANRIGSRIPLSWQHLLFWGGLRGALGMALALGLAPGFPHRDTMIVATFAVVAFTLLVQGLTMEPLIRRLGLADQPAPPRAASSEEEQRRALRVHSAIVAHRAALRALERVRAEEAHPNWAVELLVRDYEERLAELEETATSLDPAAEVRRDRHVDEARRRVLFAEKNAYMDAEREGWLTEAEWRRIAARIDAELLALTAEEQDLEVAAEEK